MSLKTVVPACLLAIASISSNAQTAAEVVARYIQSTGGEKAWSKVQTLVCSGTYNYGGIEFPFQSYSKRPNFYRYRVPFNGKYFEQAYDGEQGWKIDAFNGETKKTRLTGKAALAMANEADVELETPFIQYKSKGHAISLAGRDTAQGIDCFKIKLTRKSGDQETYFFSSADYMLLKKQAVSKNAELKNSMLTTLYNDYCDIDGIKIPFTSISRDGDQTVLIIKVKKAEINTPVADSQFAF